MKIFTNMPRLKKAYIFHVPDYNAILLEDYSGMLVDYKKSACVNNINSVIKAC